MLKLMIPAALLTAFLPDAALAQQTAHADIHVAYRDLDLRTPAGIKMLDRRIEGAIAEVCSPSIPGDDLARKRVVARCRAAKWAEVADRRAAALAFATHGNIELAARTVR